MPKKYTVEIHRTVTVTPHNSSGWGWLIFGFVVFCIIGAVASHHKPAPPQQFENPLRDDVPGSTEPNPYDQPPPLPDNGYGEPPDTAKPEKPAPPLPIVKQAAAGRVVVSQAKIDHDGKCVVPGSLTAKKTISLDLEIDTGAGAALWVSATHLKALGIDPKSLRFREQDPDTRFGKVATVTLQVRIGDAVVKDVETNILTRWRYTFGNDETPLLGIPFLKRSGLHVEVNGDTCKLVSADGATVPAQAAPRGLSDAEILEEQRKVGRKVCGILSNFFTLSPKAREILICG